MDYDVLHIMHILSRLINYPLLSLDDMQMLTLQMFYPDALGHHYFGVMLPQTISVVWLNLNTNFGLPGESCVCDPSLNPALAPILLLIMESTSCYVLCSIHLKLTWSALHCSKNSCVMQKISDEMRRRTDTFTI